MLSGCVKGLGEGLGASRPRLSILFSSTGVFVVRTSLSRKAREIAARFVLVSVAGDSMEDG